jgi:hypothetical protein
MNQNPNLNKYLCDLDQSLNFQCGTKGLNDLFYEITSPLWVLQQGQIKGSNENSRNS